MNRIIPELPTDIYYCIATAIDDPITYRNFLQSSLTCNIQGSNIREAKQRQFFKEETIPLDDDRFEYRKTLLYKDQPTTLVTIYFHTPGCSERHVEEEYILVDGVKNGSYMEYFEAEETPCNQSDRFVREPISVMSYYKNGVQHGEYREFFKDGHLAMRGQYFNGDRHGEWELYYPNGTLRVTGYYDNGMKDGRWNFYDRDGVISSSLVYRNNWVETTDFYKNGKYLRTIKSGHIISE